LYLTTEGEQVKGIHPDKEKKTKKQFLGLKNAILGVLVFVGMKKCEQPSILRGS